MTDFLMWFTDMGNSKTLAAVLFFAVFVGILFYVFTGKERKERFDQYRYIPFMDDEDDLNRAIEEGQKGKSDR